MAYETIAVERRGRIAVLSFNRPHVLNAFDPGLVSENSCGDGRVRRRRRDSGDRRARRRSRFLRRVRSQGGRRHRRQPRPGRLAQGARSRSCIHHAVLGLPQADGRGRAWVLPGWRLRTVARLRHHGRVRGRSFRRSRSQVRLGRGGPPLAPRSRIEGGAGNPAYGRRSARRPARACPRHRQSSSCRPGAPSKTPWRSRRAFRPRPPRPFA